MKQQGILCINKPAGWTSHDVVAAVRRRLGIKRVGHTGTLDPMATGVLPVAVGRATRMIEYYEADLKTYRAEMQLGMTTDTLDITGTVLTQAPFDGVTEDAVRAALRGLCGEIMQVPPQYSAVKVNGRRLYEYARKGQAVEVKPRRAYIDDIYAVEIDPAAGRVAFTVDCAKGTYVRTLCDDAGCALGCGAVMTSLVRTASGPFTLAAAVTTEELFQLSDEDLDARVVPVEDTLENLGEVILADEPRERYYRNGRTVEETAYQITRAPNVPLWLHPDSLIANTYKVLNQNGEFLGTGHIERETGALRPDKVIPREDI